MCFRMKSSESKPFIRILRNLLPLILLSTLGSQNTPTTTHGEPLPDPQGATSSAKIQFQRSFLEEANCFSNFLDLGILWFQVSRTIHCQPRGPTKALCLRCRRSKVRKLPKVQSAWKTSRVSILLCPKNERNWGNGNWLRCFGWDKRYSITAAASTFTPNWYHLFRGRFRIWSWWGLS